MPLTGGDINKIPPGPGGSARLRAGAYRHLHDHRRGTTARPGRPFLPHGICRILTRKNTMPPTSTTRVAATPAVLPPPRPAPGVPSGSPALASARDRRPAHRLQTTIIKTPRDLASDPGTAEPQRAPAGLDWQDVALPLRLLLGRGPWLAIATVVGARGAVVRRPGTVLAVTEAGQIIGFNPAGPLDRAIPDLAAHQRAAFYAADSPSWPRDDQPQARQERQSPRPLPRPGPARPSVRALVLAGHRVHRAPAGTAAPHRRTGRAPARRPLPRRRDQD